jgi:hypothetical protein
MSPYGGQRARYAPVMVHAHTRFVARYGPARVLLSEDGTRLSR